MTTKSGLQSRQERYTLFAQRRQIAANTGKGFGTCNTAKTPRNLLLELDHAHISLRLIGVKLLKWPVEIHTLAGTSDVIISVVSSRISIISYCSFDPLRCVHNPLSKHQAKLQGECKGIAK